MRRYLSRRGLLEGDADDGQAGDDLEGRLAASAVSGRTPPTGPSSKRGLASLPGEALAFEKPLCAPLDGFTLHAATRAGGQDEAGREALLRYVLRPPLAQDRVELRDGGLVRIALERAYAADPLAVEMDPLPLLARLAASVPPPRLHTVEYSGVLAPARPLRSRIVPQPAAATEAAPADGAEDGGKTCKGHDRPWAELLKRTFGLDVLGAVRRRAP